MKSSNSGIIVLQVGRQDLEIETRRAIRKAYGVPKPVVLGEFTAHLERVVFLFCMRLIRTIVPFYRTRMISRHKRNMWLSRLGNFRSLEKIGHLGSF